MTHLPVHLLPKLRSRLLLNHIGGLPCSLRIASLVQGGRCAHESTVVACHLPTLGKGMSTKVSDLFVAAGCAACHDLLDRRDSRWSEIPRDALWERMLHGLAETQMRLVCLGVIRVEGAEDLR